MRPASEKDAVQRDPGNCIRSGVRAKPIEPRGSIGKDVGKGKSSKYLYFRVSFELLTHLLSPPHTGKYTKEWHPQKYLLRIVRSYYARWDISMGLSTRKEQ